MVTKDTYFLLFSVDTGGKKHKEKLKVAENRSPHVLMSRLSTDVCSVPPSRSSDTLQPSLAPHFNPPQVCALTTVSLFLYSYAFVSVCGESHFIYLIP